jgi:phosphoenolpyruvate phosphomutase / 2-hydroxyethylphosphonate cytidylyltransferase
MKNKIVYVGLTADILHKGHLNILKIAKKYGRVVVGLLTDEAITTYKPFPILSFEERKVVLQNLKYVSEVIPQNTLDYSNNLNKIKPDYVVHGSDWKTGVQKNIRKKVIQEIKKWNGKLIEPTYTKGISSSEIKKKISTSLPLIDGRRSRLKRLIASKKIVRVLESHSPLTGMIIEELFTNKKGKREEFDAMWSSSLTDSSIKGKPDNQSVDYSSRLEMLNDILDVTSKPIIFDADNGGRIEHMQYLVKSLDRMGISAMVIEDKIGLKKNSLFKDQSDVKQDTIKNFKKKISVAKKISSKDFMVIARIESFILGKGLNDAIKRAEEYSKAGADAILIHSKDKSINNLTQFAKKFSNSKFYKPLVCVPSAYPQVKENELSKIGFKIVIYANHLLRTSYKSMKEVALEILTNQRAFNSRKKMSTIKEVISLIK